jgi:hypothetical protein
MSTTKKHYPRPPKGYRVLRRGEIRKASDIRYSFDFDNDTDPSGRIERWGKLDSIDRLIVGYRHNGNGKGHTPFARKITKKKARK